MKNILFLILIIALLAIQNLQAQQQIVVQNGSNVSLYSKLDSAIIHSNNGDTLYIPGGIFQITQLIDKELHIIGVGHNPDSTTATVTTHIMNPIQLCTGANGGSLTGVYIDNSIDFPTYTESVTNYTITRSNLSLQIWTNNASNISFFENIIRGNVNTYNEQSWVFYNNIFEGTIAGLGENSVLTNNIFLNQSSVSTISYSTFSTFENNIFLEPNGASTIYNINYSIFNNNLFVENISFPIGDNLDNNNIVNQPSSSIFINQTGNSFNYSHDYHLQPSSPGKNAGTDGTDIGIYGGVFPWKDGSLPSNPHIFSKTISSTTDPNGSLPINVTVKAQNN